MIRQKQKYSKSEWSNTWPAYPTQHIFSKIRHSSNVLPKQFFSNVEFVSHLILSGIRGHKESLSRNSDRWRERQLKSAAQLLSYSPEEPGETPEASDKNFAPTQPVVYRFKNITLSAYTKRLNFNP